MNLPFVSVIIPCRNESKYIGKCLDSVIAQDYPKERYEILIVDGMSEDSTRQIVSHYAEQHSRLSCIENPQRIVPTALNAGIKYASGGVIIRMDAHTVYATDYISKCVQYLLKYDVDNVGGIWVTMPGEKGLVPEAIAFALSHPFGVGNAHYRTGSLEPRFVDTVPFGCYKKEVFERIGYFDEDLVRNQDDEFNHRLIKNGGKVLLVPEIVSYYYARDSLPKLSRMYYQYGYFKPLVALKLRAVLTLRQLVPAVFLGVLCLSALLSYFIPLASLLLFTALVSYISMNLFVSAWIAVKKGYRYVFVLPMIFSAVHFSYATGYFSGVLDFAIIRKHIKKSITNIPLSR